jgi:hypothetical protein
MGIYRNITGINQLDYNSEILPSTPTSHIRGLPVVRVQPCRDVSSATMPADAQNTAGTRAANEGLRSGWWFGT